MAAPSVVRDLAAGVGRLHLRSGDAVTGPRLIDAAGVRCLFHSNGCTDAVLGAGGLDVHHGWPVFMGGPATTSGDTVACPNHHRRQHALLRYLVECDLAGVAPAWAVRRRFNELERSTAAWAVQRWVAVGRPVIRSWNVPAARAATA